MRSQDRSGERRHSTAQRDWLRAELSVELAIVDQACSSQVKVAALQAAREMISPQPLPSISNDPSLEEVAAVVEYVLPATRALRQSENSTLAILSESVRQLTEKRRATRIEQIKAEINAEIGAFIAECNQ